MSKQAYTKEQLLELCKNSFSYNEVLTKTGRTKGGNNREILKKYIDLYQIDVSHFTSSTSSVKNRITQGKKICSQCQQEKDAVQDFYWSSNGHTRNICKECVKKRKKKILREQTKNHRI